MQGASRYASFAASAALGAAFAAVAFGARGGSELSRTTIVELLLVVVAGLAVAASLAWAPRARLNGGATLLAFGAFAAFTALSVLWSISPELTWIESNRTFAYLAVLAAGVGAARLFPDGWAVVLRGVLIGAAIIVGYALASRVWPGALAGNEIYARIGQPYGYWNAVGVTAALAIPPALWLGARRSGHAPANALAYPLMGLLIVAIFLSYSRGSLGAAVIGAALWFAFVPLRLRSLAVLLVPTVVAAPVIAWALSKDAFTEDLLPLSARESVAGEFGLLLLVMCIVLLAAGLALGFGVTKRPPTLVLRKQVGLAAAAVAIALPLVAFTSVAVSDRGIGGTISDRVDELTSETATTPGGPDRLTKASSSRGRYWRQAGDIFNDRPALGTGAGTFGTARLRYRNDELVARHAHGFLAQTLADIGLIGLVLSLLLAGTWLVSAARNTGLRPVRWWKRRREGGAVATPWDAERVGVVALALSALVFGLHSAIDWTWFVPAPAVMAFLAAGFVAGRGPVTALAGGPGSVPGPAFRAPAIEWRKRPEWPQLAAAGALALVTLLFAWMVWQPERAVETTDDALALAEQGRLGDAAEKARDAESINPLTPRPIYVQALIQQQQGNQTAALDTLERAVLEHPGNPRTWERLAEFQLERLNRPQDALQTLYGALYLDPRSRSVQAKFVEARARLRAESPPPAQP